MTPARKVLLIGLVTTTLFESVGLFSGAVLVGLSVSLQLPVLGLVGLAVWLVGFWGENYSVAELAMPRFNLSKPACILAMSLAEFLTWTIWLLLLTQTNFSGVVLWVILFVLTHLHHAFQFCFFASDGTVREALTHPLMLAAAAIEAVAGQWLLVQVMQTAPQDMNLSALILPLLGLLCLFTIEHFVAGLMRPVLE